ncbi:glycosyltransferase family 2 protein [Vibrio cholerae]|uniref:glycosyltransferase family 2 protein n=1 Tax=Vibrio cholerae TaxID=666 RepID=UPI0018F0BB1E|nr:glycosyltransferase family 2 protein [Vibrio cholerae]MBJ6879714.1 glycosyltransferase family 2 protein [Vibrio cholerae]MBJ6883395.1 glycosyltransferase family 2 protein [Vibrio cholerae]MBJ6890754.1 glycosyltransferase family 2 protein [Vibrio cholerae]
MIDIVLATYNGEKYVSEQIKSIQTSKSYDENVSRLVIVDDGSTDDTLLILEEFCRLDEKLVVKTNLGKKGPKGNFSYGLSLCDAEYTLLCDQDDVWLDDKIEKTFCKMRSLEERYGEKTPLLVFTDLLVVDSELNTIGKSFFKYQSINPDWSEKLSQLVVQNVAPGCTMMVNRALLDLASPIPREAMMHDWWLMIVASAFGKIAYLDEPTIMYRQHENNQVGAKSLKFSRLVKNFNTGCNNLFDASVQAKVFVERYEDHLKEALDDYELDKVKCFSNLHHESYINNLSGFFNAKYRKNNVLRNLGLLAAIHWKIFR